MCYTLAWCWIDEVRRRHALDFRWCGTMRGGDGLGARMTTTCSDDVGTDIEILCTGPVAHTRATLKAGGEPLRAAVSGEV